MFLLYLIEFYRYGNCTQYISGGYKRITVDVRIYEIAQIIERSSNVGYTGATGGSIIGAGSISGRCHQLQTGIGDTGAVATGTGTLPESIINAESVEIEVEHTARPQFNGIKFLIGIYTYTYFISAVTYQPGRNGIIIIRSILKHLHTVAIQADYKEFQHISAQQPGRSLNDETCTDLTLRRIDRLIRSCPDSYDRGVGGNTCQIIVSDKIVGVTIYQIILSREVGALAYTKQTSASQRGIHSGAIAGIGNHGIACISFADTAGITGDYGGLGIYFPIGSDIGTHHFICPVHGHACNLIVTDDGRRACRRFRNGIRHASRDRGFQLIEIARNSGVSQRKISGSVYQHLIADISVIDGSGTQYIQVYTCKLYFYLSTRFLQDHAHLASSSGNGRNSQQAADGNLFLLLVGGIIGGQYGSSQCTDG